MYKLAPVFNHSIAVELPTCMYSIKPSTISILNPAVETEIRKEELQERHTMIESAEEILALLQRQEHLLKRLSDLDLEVKQLEEKYAVPEQCLSQPVIESGSLNSAVKQSSCSTLLDLVICANPEHPPVTLFVLKEQLSQQFRVGASCHTHSSATNLRNLLATVFNSELERSNCDIIFTLIWKNVSEPSLTVCPTDQVRIEGEINIARYLSRLLDPPYDGPSVDIVRASIIDNWLDMASDLLSANSKETTALFKSFNNHLGKNNWLLGSEMSLADVALWGVLSHAGMAEKAPGNIKNWYNSCCGLPIFQAVKNCLV